MGKKDSCGFGTTIEEDDRAVVALCQRFEETKQQHRWCKNHREDLQEGGCGGGDKGG